jgi:hypothetical protein
MQTFMQQRHIGMGIAQLIRFGQPTSVEKRGMIELILNHRIAALQQPVNGPEIGHVAGGEQQNPGLSGEISQRFLQRLMIIAVTGQQVSSTAADPFLIYSLFESLFDIGMGSEAEIVITAERQHGLAVNRDINALFTQAEAVLAVTTRRFTIG